VKQKGIKMKKILALSLLAGGFISVAQAQETAKVPFTVEKLNSLNSVHSISVSPDGSKLVYALKTQSGSDLYLKDLQTNTEDKKLTSHPATESDVIWTNDNNSILFLANRDQSTQVWQLNLKGGEAQPLTDLALSVNGYKLSPDNNKLALALEVFPTCQTIQCSVEKKAELKNVKHTAKVYKQLPVRHWDTWKTEFRSHIFVTDISKKAATQAKDLTPDWDTDIPAKPFAGMEEVTFTQDSLNVVFSAKAPSKDQSWTTNYDLFKVSIEGGEVENLTPDNKAWDSQPAFSADGRFMVYLAMKKEGFEADKFSLMLKDLKTSELKEVAPLWDRSVASFTFAPNNRAVYVIAQDVGQKSIYEISTNFGDVRKIYSDGSAGDLHLAGNKIIFSRHALNSPKNIFSVNRDGSDLHQLTDINKNELANVQFGEFEQFNFPGWNDEKVHGYFVKPWNFDADKVQQGEKYPIAFLVHGGPQGSFGNLFSSRWNAQLWAAQGYGVVMIDFHGSTGYGQAFTDSISRDWGGKPLEDLQKGFEFITKQQSWLDADNACALGASYGGYMMNWIAGNWTDGFNCLINHAGLFDMDSFYQSTEELWFPEHDMGGPFWTDAKDYKSFNPASFTKNWKTPMLVIHGLKDYRVPYAQGLGAYTTLQRMGIESKLVIYPDENHWILNKDNRVHWYGEVFDWMKKHTQK